jgi:hypothetical protein
MVFAFQVDTTIAPVCTAQVPVGAHGDIEPDDAVGFTRRLPLRITTRFASKLGI